MSHLYLAQKGQQPFSILQIVSTASNPLAHCNTLHRNLVIPNASHSQLILLRILVQFFVEMLLTNLCKVPIAQTKLQKYWGTLPKYTLPVTIAYTDDSASQTQNKAGFGVLSGIGSSYATTHNFNTYPGMPDHCPGRGIWSSCCPLTLLTDN
jgi:hypothetical protein